MLAARITLAHFLVSSAIILPNSSGVIGIPHVDLARIGFGIGDEFGNRLSWNRWIDHHHERGADDACNRCDVADEVEVELIVKDGGDRVR